MRVAMITTVYPRFDGDAAGNFVASLAEALVKEGAEVTVVAPHDDGASPEEMRAGVRVLRPRYLPAHLERVAYRQGIPANLRASGWARIGLLPFLVRFTLAIRRASRSADVVHAHWAPTGVLAALAAGHTPLVLTLHGTDVALARRGGLWRRLLVFAARRASVVIAVAESLGEEVRVLTGDATHPITIPNGVPATLTASARAPQPETATSLAFVGRLTHEKGASELLSAVLSLEQDVSLVMAGDGPLRDDLARQIAEAGAEDRVRLVGAVPHARALEIIAAADMFVLPSRSEGCPLVVLEALALGTPVVATPVGDIPHLLGTDGALVPVGDADALAVAIDALAADRPRRQRMSDEGRARAKRLYTWPDAARRTHELYESVLSEG